MRVLVLPHAAEIGGSQLNAIDLASAVRDRGHDVLVACENGPLVERVAARGLAHIQLPTGARRPSPGSALRLDRCVVERGVDVVHSYEWPPAFDAIGSRALHGTAVVGTVLSMSVVSFYPRTVPLLVGTEQIRRAALDAGSRRVQLLEPPVDTLHDHPGYDPEDFRARFGLDQDATLIVMVCRLVPELKREGLLAACDAVGELARSGHRVQLVIVGDGSCRHEVEQHARRADALAGRPTVVLAGQLADPRPAYAAADIVVGQGGSALRGMAFGKPLVVVGEGGFSELVTAETTPRFLDEGWFGLGPGSRGSGVPALRAALAALLEDAELRAELGAAAHRLVLDRFSLVRAAALLETEYRHVLENRAPRTDEWVDLVRSGTGMVSHKVRRRVLRRWGTVPTDDANARPVCSPAGPKGEHDYEPHPAGRLGGATRADR